MRILNKSEDKYAEEVLTLWIVKLKAAETQYLQVQGGSSEIDGKQVCKQILRGLSINGCALGIHQDNTFGCWEMHRKQITENGPDYLL